MRNIWPILKRELKSYFVSPIAYVVIFIFLLIAGYFFYANFTNYSFISLQAASSSAGFQGLTPTDVVLRPLFGNLSVLMLLMMPLLTMRLFAEEKKTGTMELLLTYPVRDIEVLLGKFLACLLVFALMLALTLSYIVFLAVLTDPEFGPIITGYVGLLLVGAAFISLGILASSLTENQIVAAAISFGLLLLFWIVGWSSYFVGPKLAAVINHVSLLEHLESFSKGVFDTNDIIYYLSFAFLCLFLTSRSLESKHWRG